MTNSIFSSFTFLQGSAGKISSLAQVQCPHCCNPTRHQALLNPGPPQNLEHPLSQNLRHLPWRSLFPLLLTNGKNMTFQ